MDVGEWIPGWGWMSLTFLVAALAVVGLAWWVLKGESQNRRFEQSVEEPPEDH
jgi:hypothetical protein